MITTFSNQPKSFLKAIKIAQQIPNYRVNFLIPAGKVTLIVPPPTKKLPDEGNWIDEFAGLWKGQKKAKKMVKLIEQNRSLHIYQKLT